MCQCDGRADAGGRAVDTQHRGLTQYTFDEPPEHLDAPEGLSCLVLFNWLFLSVVLLWSGRPLLELVVLCLHPASAFVLF